MNNHYILDLIRRYEYSHEQANNASTRFEEQVAEQSETEAYDALQALGIELYDKETLAYRGEQIKRELIDSTKNVRVHFINEEEFIVPATGFHFVGEEGARSAIALVDGREVPIYNRVEWGFLWYEQISYEEWRQMRTPIGLDPEEEKDE